MFADEHEYCISALSGVFIPHLMGGVRDYYLPAAAGAQAAIN